MQSTMIMLNIIMSALSIGAISVIVLLTMRLSHGYPRRRGRADWRGPATQPIIYRAASTATAVKSRAR